MDFDDFPLSSALPEQEIEKIANGLISSDSQVAISTVKLIARQEDSDLGRHANVREGLVHVLRRGGEEAVIWACHALCTLGQIDELTRIQLGRTAGLYEALRDVVQGGAGQVRLAACTALAGLSEVQCVESNAERMAEAPGLLEALVAVMDPEHGGEEDVGEFAGMLLEQVQVRDAAAMVLHNASNAEVVAQRMVDTPAMLHALRTLAVGRRCKYWGGGDAEPEFSRASINAMCAINNLSKHPAVRVRIRHHHAAFLHGLARFLQDLSGHPLAYKQVGVDAGGAKAILVAAVMSAAKLCTELELEGMRIGSTEIANIVFCLRKGVSGEAWQGILWSVTDCVLPLLPLASCAQHRRTLVQCGVVPVLLQVLARWSMRGTVGAAASARVSTRKRRKVAHRGGGGAGGEGGHCGPAEAATCGGDGGEKEGGREGVAEDVARRWSDERHTAVHLCLLLTARMSVDDTPHLLRTRSAITTLREVGRSLREVEEHRTRDHTLIEVSAWPLRDRNVALCMGSHDRLGSDPSCLIGLLDVSLLKLILETASTPSALAFNLAMALSHADAHVS